MQALSFKQQIFFNEWLGELDSCGLFLEAQRMHEITGKFARELEELPDTLQADLMVRMGNMIMQQGSLRSVGHAIMKHASPSRIKSVWSARNFEIAKRYLNVGQLLNGGSIRDYTREEKLLVFEALRSLSGVEVETPHTFRLMVAHEWCLEQYLSEYESSNLRAKIQRVTGGA